MTAALREACEHSRFTADDKDLLPPPWFEFCNDCPALRWQTAPGAAWTAWTVLGGTLT